MWATIPTWNTNFLLSCDLARFPCNILLIHEEYLPQPTGYLNPGSTKSCVFHLKVTFYEFALVLWNLNCQHFHSCALHFRSLNFLCVGVLGSMSLYHVLGTQDGLSRVSDPLELELWMVWTDMLVLGIVSRILWKSLPCSEPPSHLSSPSFRSFFFKVLLE